MFVDLSDVQDELGLRRAVAAFKARCLAPGARLDAQACSVKSWLSWPTTVSPSLPSLTVSFRTIATVEGSLQHLDPNFDFVAEAGMPSSD